MKAKQFKTMMIAMITAIFLTGSLTSVAQQGHGQKPPKNAKIEKCELDFMLDLTDEQKAKIKESKTKHLKAVKPLKNKLGIYEAELKALATADKADMNAINKKIDEISSVKTDIQKSKMVHIQEIRSLLTDDQRIIFDTHFPHKGHRKGHGPHHGPKEPHGPHNR
jgi:Spy/CpxP family protein refolding chaperone